MPRSMIFESYGKNMLRLISLKKKVKLSFKVSLPSCIPTNNVLSTPIMRQQFAISSLLLWTQGEFLISQSVELFTGCQDGGANSKLLTCKTRNWKSDPISNKYFNKGNIQMVNKDMKRCYIISH